MSIDSPLTTNQFNRLLNKTEKNELYFSFQHLADRLFVPRLSLVASIQNQPDKASEYLIQLSNIFMHKDHTQVEPVKNYWRKACSILFQCPNQIVSKKVNLINNNALNLQLEDILKQTSEYLSDAFTSLSINEELFFVNYAGNLQRSLSSGELLAFDPDINRKNTNIRLFSIASKINYSKLNQAFSYLLKLIEAQRMNQYLNLNYSQKTIITSPFGEIVFGTRGNDKHIVKPGSLIIDPAGNDSYFPQQSSTQSNYQKSTVIIDLAGNDHYLATSDPGTPYGISGAILGLSLLVDQQGNDRYDGKHWSQGSAFAGISLLNDQHGNDSYNAESLSQATALFGIGLLLDNQGDDLYHINHHGQALGLPYGLGILLDQQGNDDYQMSKTINSAYSIPDSFQSWGQATGMGFRYILPGGIGLLVDKQGSDNFQAGEFAQGGGYYYGLGLLLNAGNDNDSYQGYRYNAGFSAHQAIGAFIDAGGNDRYQSYGTAMAGLAWDQSLSLFIDQKGDDNYILGDFSFGAQAIKSISLFYNDKQ